MQGGLLADLEAAQTLAFLADRADRLRRQFALGIVAAAGGELTDPGQLEPFDPRRGRQVDPFRDI